MFYVDFKDYKLCNIFCMFLWHYFIMHYEIMSVDEHHYYLVLGNPLPNPGHNCAILDTAGEHTWQSSSCAKKMGYICYKDGAPPTPPQSTEKCSPLFSFTLIWPL